MDPAEYDCRALFQDEIRGGMARLHREMAMVRETLVDVPAACRIHRREPVDRDGEAAGEDG